MCDQQHDWACNGAVGREGKYDIVEYECTDCGQKFTELQEQARDEPRILWEDLD